jgi:hypothetical protein
MQETTSFGIYEGLINLIILPLNQRVNGFFLKKSKPLK